MNNAADNEKKVTQSNKEYAESTTTPKFRIEQEPEKKAPTTTTPKVKPKPDSKSG